MKRIAALRPSLSDIYPNKSMKPMAPNAGKDDIHDSSSCVILPAASGLSADLNSSKFGPVNPITTP